MKINVQAILSGKTIIHDVPKDCVAICGAAIRTDRWLDIYNSFKEKNKTKFIMIFCGHIVPEFELPDNFYFIKSNLLPAACGELCLRVARSIPEVKYLVSVPDDCSFSDGAIDMLVAEHEKHSGEFIEIGMGFWGDKNANEQSALPLKFYNHDPESPFLTICGMRSKETCNTIGSIDKRFKGQHWDVDRTMRLLSMGGKIKTLDHLKVIEMEPWNGSHLLGPRFFSHDRPLLNSFWTYVTKDGKLIITRSSQVESYEDCELEGELQ